MSFLTSIWHYLLFLMTAWQTIKSLIQAKNNVYKAENIKENQPVLSMLIPDEQMTPLHISREYLKATLNMSKATLYAHTAFEIAVENCGAQQYIPGVYFCRYLYPIAVTLATVETVCQASSLLTSKQKPH